MVDRVRFLRSRRRWNSTSGGEEETCTARVLVSEDFNFLCKIANTWPFAQSGGTEGVESERCEILRNANVFVS